MGSWWATPTYASFAWHGVEKVEEDPGVHGEACGGAQGHTGAQAEVCGKACGLEMGARN